MKFNILNIYAIFLTLAIWALVALAMFYITGLLFAGVFFLASFKRAAFELILYTIIYTAVLAFIYNLKCYFQEIANKKDGKEDPVEKLNIKFWVKICLGLLALQCIILLGWYVIFCLISSIT